MLAGRNRKALVVGCLVVAVALSGCDLRSLSGLRFAKVGTRCTKAGDFARDVSFVLVCGRKKTWERKMSVSEADTLLRDYEQRTNPRRIEGAIDSVSAMNGPWIRVQGWAISSQPTFELPLQVGVSVNGREVPTIPTNQKLQVRTASERQLTGADTVTRTVRPTDVGSASGVDVMVNATARVNEVCLMAKEWSFSGGAPVLDPHLHCTTFEAQDWIDPIELPFSMDDVQVSPERITVTGWALPINEAAYGSYRFPEISVGFYSEDYEEYYFVDSPVDLLTPRPDVAALYPGYGENLGFSVTEEVSAGYWTVCTFRRGEGRIVWALASGETRPRCARVSVPS